MTRSEQNAEKRAEVESLWAEGLTAREIARRLGWKAKEPSAVIAIYRGRGYHLPHRYAAGRRPAPTVGGSPRVR